MSARRLSHLGLCVSDLERSVAFYRDGLGFAELSRKRFDDAGKRGRLRLIASPDGADGSVTIHQDARVHAAILEGDDRVEFAQQPGRRTYVHVVRGGARVNGQALSAGDAAKLEGGTRVAMEPQGQAEVLLFDLP